MLFYLFKRLLFFVPTFFIVSMLAFGLSRMAPGDPAAVKSEYVVNSVASMQAQKRAYRENAARLGLDLPAFYFGISTQAQTDTLHRILPFNTRDALRQLAHQYGNWEQVEHYYHQLLQLEKTMIALPDSLKKTDEGIAKRQATEQLLATAKEEQIDYHLEVLKTKVLSAERSAIEDVLAAHESMMLQASPNRKYLPAFHWYGIPNQYHRWMSAFLRGDFGVSIRDFRPVSDKIKGGLRWTLWINLSAIFLAFLFSIPLGVWSALKKGEKTDRFISIILFLLYSLPSFWIATLLLIFFTTPEYGMNWFASIGLGNTTLARDGWWTVFLDRTAHLLLPIFCVTYAALAFITRQMRASMIEVLGKPYIQTAKAKGLSMRKVVWKHAFRNALFPLITIFGSLLPSLIAGSIIIEFIFNIKGMGWLLYDSIYAQDWPVVYAILMIGAILTMLGLLLADLLYAIADPRVRLD